MILFMLSESQKESNIYQCKNGLQERKLKGVQKVNRISIKIIRRNCTSGIVQ